MDTLIIVLIIGIVFILCYSKNKQSQFTKLEQEQPIINKVKNNPEVHYLDTRYDYPNVPPVNPNAYKTLLVSSIPANSDLYSNQGFNIDGYILNQDENVDNTNQLEYSGGSTQILKIPLQMNEPFNEQLRSQEVMITPYNRIKYNITGGESCTKI